MKLGFAVPATGSWATPDNQVTIAQLAEQHGYHSVWVLQRLLNPLDLTIGTYRNTPDPLVTLAYLAGVTDRVRLGVAVVNLPFFSPALLAQQSATLDRVSRGRLDLALGLGWLPAEFEASGIGMDRRGARADEFVQLLDALWTKEIIEHQGEFYRVPATRLEPKPVQQPRPPLLLGGGTSAGYRRVGRLADGWVSASRHDLTEIGVAIGEIKDAARENGRDPDSLRFVVRAVLAVGGAGPADRKPLSGSADQIRADFDRLAAQGVTEAFIDLNFDAEHVGMDVDPAASLDYAQSLLTEFAPR
ncbi:MAG: TIGR03619 family F420-dependent LLM class oxidoreductase [Jatrophihabitantaceae bacterium]